MKNIRTLIILSCLAIFTISAYAGQDIVKTMPLESTITDKGTVRLIVRLTTEANGPDIGISLHQGAEAAPWNDAMAIAMFDFIKNTNGGIHLAGYNGDAAWDWQNKVKQVEKERDIALWLTVDPVNNTHSLAAQMQGETTVTDVFTDYTDRASIKGQANANVGFCSVFVNNKEGQTASAVQIVSDAQIVSTIEPYDFGDSPCFTTYADRIMASIKSDSSYQFAGQDITTTGIYYDTLMNAGGCDSILSLDLTVVPSSDKALILQQLQKVNNYYMSKNPETEQINSGASKWLEGSYFTGHTALYKLHPTAENMRYAMQWGENNDWNIGDTRGEADNQCVGQIYMDLYYANGAQNDAMLAKVGKSVSDMVNRASATDDWDWVDALYMAMPTLTRYGILNNDNTYFDKLYEMYHSTKVSQKLYNAKDSLWYRDGAVLSGKKHTCYWARGNGWVFGAHVRTLQYLPEDDAHRQEYLDTYKAMAAKLKSVQRADGFWNATLDDVTYYPGPETSGTGFFVYGLAWGINNGILDKATYLPTVIKGWNGLVEQALDTDGRIGYVQGVADEPKDDQPVTFSKSREYGYGNFLLAGTEVIHLVEGELPTPSDFYVKDVEVLADSKIRVNFFEAVEKTSAETVANYTVNKGVTVESAVLSADGMSCELSLSSLQKGGYGISFSTIKSITGKTIEPASGQYFMINEEGVSTINSITKAETTLKLYPNPTNQDYVNIEWKTDASGELKFRLINTSGKVLISQTADQQLLNYRLNINTIAKGIYILNVSGIDFNSNQKLVIQ